MRGVLLRWSTQGLARGDAALAPEPEGQEEGAQKPKYELQALPEGSEDQWVACRSVVRQRADGCLAWLVRDVPCGALRCRFSGGATIVSRCLSNAVVSSKVANHVGNS